ncbi:MAG TPA: hypothetical protein VFB22_11300 [Candidatus Baltobacteraceae bacterium]|nr:hypothetical protein [Candidatus Baltobacteraceae bacterium]
MTTAVATDSAKRALLDHLIDDASLFPPRGLPMRAALRHHARHSESAYPWIGGRFVLPASRADEFATTRADGDPIALSVILDAATRGAKGDVVRADLHRVERLRVLPGVSVESLELRLPGGLDAAGLERAVAAVTTSFGGSEIALWIEGDYDAGWRLAPDETMSLLAQTRSAAPAQLTLGAKVRCGGARPGSTPPAEDLASFVVAAQAAGVPWKATAGLHHPVRTVRGGTPMHGFLNLFVAGTLLHAGALEPARVAAVLAETDARAFVVDPMHVGWRDARVDAEAIAAARAHCVSYGSCSFDEPVNDLRELGILL